MSHGLHAFDDPETCREAFVDDLAGRLAGRLQEKPRLTLALSGGRTPESVLPLLAAKPLDWSRVDVTLTDERWVPPTDPASNAGMVRRCFLERGADAATFHALWTDAPSPADGLAAVNASLAAVAMPPDVAYLGFGEDGHVASLFPAVDAAGFDAPDGVCVAGLAPGAPRDRISLSLSALLGTATLYLLFGGADKARVYEAALSGPADAGLPLSLLLHSRHPDIRVFQY